MSERDVLSNDKKKTPVDCQGRQSRERLIERPWLQLMCCAPVSSREGGHVFWSSESRWDRGPKRSSGGVEEDKMWLGPDDVNLQTEKLHCNYSVLIGSPE